MTLLQLLSFRSHSTNTLQQLLMIAIKKKKMLLLKLQQKKMLRLKLQQKKMLRLKLQLLWLLGRYPWHLHPLLVKIVRPRRNQLQPPRKVVLHQPSKPFLPNRAIQLQKLSALQSLRRKVQARHLRVLNRCPARRQQVAQLQEPAAAWLVRGGRLPW